MIGSHVGPYRIERELGSGGMGAVWLAVVDGDAGDPPREGLLRPASMAPGPQRGERVAVKIIHPHLLSTPGFFKRFLREAEIGKAVRHENVVRTFDVDATLVDGRQANYLVMEYVEGRTLREMLRDLRAVPESLLRELATQIASGLAAIHAAGIVHRDLKPENVLVTKEHQVRIMDLGVARLQEATVAITKEGQFAGSLLYAAPEQFRHEPVGPATDLYSLGVMLYELASGENPFERDNAAQVIAAHLNLVPRSVRDMNSEISPFLAELTAALLAKQPAGRVGSATELRALLVDGESSAWWKSREKSVREREHRLPPIQVRRETELHGRETEMTLLADAWKRAQDGHGSTVFIEGEAGIGKTRLVDAFLRSIDVSDAHVLYGSYPPSGGAGGLSDAVTEKFGSANLADALKPHLTVTPSLVPAFAAMVQHEAPPSGSEALTGDAIQAVFCHLAKSLAAEKPVLWIVDELHFAPAESRATVLALARVVEPLRVLLVVTARPGLPDEDMAHFSRLQNFRRATLGRLSPRQIVELLRDAFKSDALADRLGAKIGYKSDGVPFFVFEMIRGLKDGQFIKQQADGTYAETQVVSDIEVPSAVRDLIEGRLRDVTDEDRAMLDAAAVMGFEFDPDLVARVLGSKRIVALQALAKIERRSGVVRAAGRMHRFDHHQIQEVLYGGMPLTLREEYHAALAEAFAEREKLTAVAPKDVPGESACFMASHGLGGSRPEAALPYLDGAMDHLEEAYRNDAVLELADRALAASGLLVGKARCELLLRKAVRLDLVGRREAARAALDEARILADADGDAALRSRAHAALGASLWRASKSDDAMTRFGAAVEFARAAGDRTLEVRAIRGIASVFHSLGRHAEARDQVERGLAIARDVGDKVGEAGAATNLGVIVWYLGLFEESRAQFERTIALARECGLRRDEAWATGNLGWVFSAVGRYADARDHHARHISLARELGDRQGETSADRALGYVSLSLGRAGAAREAYDRALTLCREIGAREAASDALDGRARVAAEDGRDGEAEAAWREAIALMDEIRELTGACQSRSLLGAFLARQSRADEARALLDAALATAREAGLPGTQTVALAHLACLPSGDAAPAEAALAEHAPRLTVGERMDVRLALFRATGKREHLAEAKRLLDDVLAANPESDRAPMLANVRLNREIAAAAKAAGL